MAATSDAILTAAEAMSDGERWRYMLGLSRRAATDAAVKADIDALAADPGYYPRRLAVMAGAAGGEPDRLLTALTGASASLAALAYDAAARLVDDETLATLLPGLPPSRRGRLARACADRRPGVVERAFPNLSTDDRSRFVGYSGTAFVAAQLADSDFVGRLASADWSRIARRHPGPALEALIRRLDEDAELPRPTLVALKSVIPIAARRAPREALALLQAAAARTPLRNLPYHSLLPYFPADVAALILADGKAPCASLRGIDDETLKALLRQRGRGVSGRELRRLTPETRRGLYEDGILEPLRNDAGALPTEVVGYLHATARQAEARRAWAAPRLLAHPPTRLPYLAFLPFAEGLGETKPFIGDPEGEVRALACAAVVGTGRYEPARLAEILAFVQARRNEQDPVRLAMMTALAALPPTRWRDAHLAAISEIVGAALSARDASPQTRDAAARLLIRMAPEHMGVVGPGLTRVAEKLGRVPRINLEERVSDAQMAMLTPEILPLLTVWRDRSQILAVVGFLGGFGRRLKASPPLIEFLVGMTDDPRSSAASPALDTLVNARAHARLKSLIPDLLKRDPSWILSPLVAFWINRRRQDLLTDFLRPRVYVGRFNSHKTAFLPAFEGGFRRWTENQQQTYARSLISIAEGGQRSLWQLRSALLKIALMPAADPGPILSLARLDSPDMALRDMAVTALGRLDAGRGVPGLIDALDDDRGRIAIYALRHAILDMPAAAAMDFLRRAPLNKVTVAKEVVRLAGEVGGEAAWSFLAEFARDRDPHRDVRIAVLRALWSYLDRDEVWDLFATAAAADPAAARATVHIPQDRLSKTARAHLARHMERLLAHESAAVRFETVRRLAAWPIPTAGTSLAAKLAGLLGRPADVEVSLAATALTLGVPLGDVPGLADVFGKNRTPRALQAIVGALAAQHPAYPSRVERVSRPLVDLLVGEGRQITLAARLAVQVLPPEALLSVIGHMSARGLLHPGAMLEAVSASRLRPGQDLGAIEPDLAMMDDPAARRIGLAVLTTQAGSLGWTQAVRARLDVYRADPALVVSEAADLIFPPDEQAK